MSRRQKQIGDHGQQIAATVLRSRGALLVEKVATPVKLIPSSINGHYRVIFGERVSGDHRAILPGGRSILAETKATTGDRNLQYSDLREHQPERLTAHAEAGGLSLLIWICDAGQFVMQWPIVGFQPGRSITVTLAKALDIPDLEKIQPPRRKRSTK